MLLLANAVPVEDVGVDMGWVPALEGPETAPPLS